MLLRLGHGVGIPKDLEQLVDSGSQKICLEG